MANAARAPIPDGHLIGREFDEVPEGWDGDEVADDEREGWDDDISVAESDDDDRGDDNVDDDDWAATCKRAQGDRPDQSRGETPTESVHHFLTQVGFNADEIGGTWEEMREYVRAGFRMSAPASSSARPSSYGGTGGYVQASGYGRYGPRGG